MEVCCGSKGMYMRSWSDKEREEYEVLGWRGVYWMGFRGFSRF